MYDVDIYAKSSMTFRQASVKKRIGCDGLEIQLLGELVVDKEGHVYRSYAEVFNLDDFKDYDIRVIHAPLIPGKDDILLEAVVDHEDIVLLHEVFCLAQKVALLKGHRVKVVLHSESYYEKLVDEDIWPIMVKVVRNLLTSCDMVDICLENVSPIRGIGKGKELHLANNYAFDNITMVKMLREDIGTDNIYTCLDTCHAMLADKYISALYGIADDYPPMDLSMQKFFSMNKNYIGLIHLADMKGSGYGKGRHGIPFTEDTKDRLHYILDLYMKYGYECPITLEVEETDFDVCDGYRSTLKLVADYLGLNRFSGREC